MSKISAIVVADSLNVQGDRLTSLLITFPRILLSEVNTHRMLSKNTSSSRAIPFEKMVESVQTNPFIPIAWQKEHKGMQGSEYIPVDKGIYGVENTWLGARNRAIELAKALNKQGVTKQLCNRLLEPFMWTTMLITGSKESWDNLFNLRCPSYEVICGTNGKNYYKSKRDLLQNFPDAPYETDLEWLQINKGQAEIHMMHLAEKIYDAMNESTPKQLKPGDWHIPFEDKIFRDSEYDNIEKLMNISSEEIIMKRVKISVAMAARTSYTIVGEEKSLNYQKMVELHDKLISQTPPHSSPLEHCTRTMGEVEYTGSKSSGKSVRGGNVYPEYGWCNNFKGFVPYRYIVDNKVK
jgi:thymidylate synthase ThyX